MTSRFDPFYEDTVIARRLLASEGATMNLDGATLYPHRFAAGARVRVTRRALGDDRTRDDVFTGTVAARVASHVSQPAYHVRPDNVGRALALVTEDQMEAL